MNNIPEPEAQKLRFYIERSEALRRQRARNSAIFAMLGATTGLVFTFFQFLSDSRIKRPDPSQRELVALRSDLQGIKARLTQLDKTVNSITSIDLSDSNSADQKRLAAAVKATDDRLRQVESVILENPERALAIPLLRKDINDSQKRVDEYRAAIKSELDRLYEQQKWMLGGIGAFLLAVIGGAATIIFKTAPKSTNSDA